jgi:mannose-6-phosphate isomerase
MIEQLIDWKPVRAGDFIYSPAGRIHAIGAGLLLIKVQQNSDVTYRLYDYGRPRELHLEAALKAARLEPRDPVYSARSIRRGRELLATGAAFTVERWRADGNLRLDVGGNDVILIPLDGQARWTARPFAGARSSPRVTPASYRPPARSTCWSPIAGPFG